MGVAVTVTPMKTPDDAVDEIALDMPVVAACAAARDGVVMVAVTSMEPAVIDREMSAASTPAAAASAAT